MLRTKAYILVLLLGVGPLGVYLAAHAQERAPWPPPPIKPPTQPGAKPTQLYVPTAVPAAAAKNKPAQRPSASLPVNTKAPAMASPSTLPRYLPVSSITGSPVVAKPPIKPAAPVPMPAKLPAYLPPATNNSAPRTQPAYKVNSAPTKAPAYLPNVTSKGVVPASAKSLAMLPATDPTTPEPPAQLPPAVTSAPAPPASPIGSLPAPTAVKVPLPDADEELQQITEVKPAAAASPPVPQMSTPEPPLADPFTPPPPDFPEPPRFEPAPVRTPEKPRTPKAPDMPRADDPSASGESDWKPVRPKKDVHVEALPLPEPPAIKKQTPETMPAPGIISDPAPIVLPESTGVRNSAQPPIAIETIPAPVRPESPGITDTIPPEPLPEPAPLPEPPPSNDVFLIPETPLATPKDIQAPEPIAPPASPEIEPLPSFVAPQQLDPAPEPPIVTPLPMPVELIPEIPKKEQELTFPAQSPRTMGDVPSLPLPPDPQPMLKEDPFHLPKQPYAAPPVQQPPSQEVDEPPLIQRRVVKPSTPPLQPKIEINGPAVLPFGQQPPILNRSQPQDDTPPVDMWKRAPAPLPITPPPAQEEDAPAFRLVKPIQKETNYSNDRLAPIPTLKPTQRPVSTQANGLPTLTVEKRGPTVARLGETLTFEILVRNGGHLAADNLVVIEDLPYGMRFVSAEPMALKQGEKLSWRIGRLQPGQQQRVSVTVQASAAGSFTSTAQVQFHVRAEHKIRIDPSDYVLSMVGPRQLEAGQTAKIEIVVNNTGNGARQGLVLKVRLPDGLTHPMGPYIETDVTIQPGENRRFTLAAKAVQVGKVVADAWLEDGSTRFGRTQAEIIVTYPQEPQQQQTRPPANDGPNSLVNNAPKVAVEQPRAPDDAPQPKPMGLAGRLTVRAIGTRVVRERDGELRVEIANYTQSGISNLAITATLPGQLDFLDASDKGMYHRATKTIYWFVDSVPAGQSRSLIVRVKGKSVGKSEFNVRAGTDAGKQALTTAPVVVEEQTSLLGQPDSSHVRLAFETKSRYKALKLATNVCEMRMSPAIFARRSENG